MPPKDPKIEAWAKSKELLPVALRADEVRLPEIAELQVLRHFNRLSQMNFSVESGTYPLGSCTMKYNPKVSEYIASSPGMREAHPFQPEGTIQGLLGIFYDLSLMLCEISGITSASTDTRRRTRSSCLTLPTARTLRAPRWAASKSSRYRPTKGD